MCTTAYDDSLTKQAGDRIVLGENGAASRKSDVSIGQSATVLVVDNDPAVRHLVTTALEGRGHKVRTATNGREALDKVRLDPPDAILLDLMTPTRIAGASWQPSGC